MIVDNRQRAVQPLERPVHDSNTGAQRNLATLTVSLCFCAALFEGLDIVAAGLVAPKLVPAFGLTPAAAGLLFSSSTGGLLIGAVFGGWIADRIGRKRVLVASMAVFGAMSLVTALSATTTGLFVSRFVTGLGLGGAMPNLIALSAEAGPASRRTTLVTLMYSGVPLGGALGGAATLWAGAMENWRVLFYIGGTGPLILSVLLARLLPESRLFKQARGDLSTNRVSVTRALFGAPNGVTTTVLWFSFFGTLLVLYLLVNWLPLLLVASGYKREDAALLSIVFNVGGGIGAVVLGWLMDRKARPLLMIAAYAGMAASLTALSLTLGAGTVAWSVVAAVSFAVGFFVIGGQLVLYGVAPNYYPTATRSTGVGAAVAAGRVGAVVGPLIAGQMLGAGNNAAAVITVLLPIVVAAGAGAVVLMFRPTPGE